MRDLVQFANGEYQIANRRFITFSNVIDFHNQVYKDVKDRLSYVASFVRTEGLMAFAETEWLRLNVPLIFRTFWLMRCLIYFAVYAIASPSIESVFDRDSLISLFKIMLVRGCETLPAILGMSSIFSWISGKVFFFLIEITCQSYIVLFNFLLFL